MRHGELADPRGEAARGPDEVRGVERFGERHQDVDGERRVQTVRGARRIADDHGVISRLPRLHVVQRERRAVRTQNVAAIIAPLVCERRRAIDADGEGCARALIHVGAGGRGGHVRRGGDEDELIHPAAVLAVGHAGVLRVSPLHDLVAGQERERTLFPTCFTRDAREGGVVRVEDQLVAAGTAVRLRRDLPLELHGARTRDGGLHGRACAIGRGRRFHGVKAVEGRLVLPDPARAAGSPGVIRIINGLGNRERRQHGEQRADGGGHGHDIADFERVAARLRELHRAEIQGQRPRAADAAAVHKRRAVMKPLVRKRRRAAHSGGEADGGALVNDPRHRLVRDDRRNGREHHLIDEYGVESVREEAALVVVPRQHKRAGVEVVGFLRPVMIAGNSRDGAAVDLEAQDVHVCFRRGLPPKAQGAGPLHRGLQGRGLAAGHGAAARGQAVAMNVRRADPPRVAVGFPDEVSVQRLGERQGRNHLQRERRADGGAGRVQDFHFVRAGLLGLRVRDGQTAVADRADEEAGIDRKIGVTVQQIRAVQRARWYETPLVAKGRGAARRDVETDGGTDIHDKQILAGVRDDGRGRPEVHLVQPRAVESGHAGRALGVRPAQHGAGIVDGEGALPPVGLAGNVRRFHAVNREAHPVLVRFRRGFPEEGNRAGTGHHRLRPARHAVANRAARRRINEIRFDIRLAAPRQPADGRAGDPDDVRVIGVEGDRQRDDRNHAQENRLADVEAVRVPHHHVIEAGLRLLRAADGQRGRLRADDIAAIAQFLAFKAPLIAQRRGAEGLDGEGHVLAGIHLHAHRLLHDHGHGRPAARDEIHLVKPAAIRAGQAARVLAVGPAQGHQPAGHDERLILPAGQAGNLRERRAVHREGQMVRVRLRRNAPPETNRAGADDGCVQRARSAVGNRPALRRRLAVVRHVRLHRPRRAEVGVPSEVWRVHRLADSERGDDAERHGRTDDPAGRIADCDGVEAALQRLRVVQSERGRGRAAHAAAVGDVRAVAFPLVSERGRAGGEDGEAGRSALGNGQRGGRGGDARRREHNEQSIGTGHDAHSVADNDGIISRVRRLHAADHERVGIHAADAVAVEERHAVQTPLHEERRRTRRANGEHRVVAFHHRLSGGLASDRGRHTDDEARAAIGRACGVDRAVLHEPRLADHGEVQIRGTHHFAHREHGQRGGTADDAAGGIADEDGVGADVRGLHVGERKRVRGRAAHARAIQESHAVKQPLIRERQRAARENAEARGLAFGHAAVRGLERNDWRGEHRCGVQRHHRARGRARRVAHEERVAGGLRGRAEHGQTRAVRAAHAVAVQQRHAVRAPPESHGHRATHACAKVRRMTGEEAEAHRLVRDEGRDADRARRVGDAVHPARVLAGRAAEAFAVTPLEQLRAGGDGVSFLFPPDFARDADNFRSANVEAQIVIARFARNFPPEGHGAGSLDVRFQTAVLAVIDVAGADFIHAVLCGDAGLRDPRGVAGLGEGDVGRARRFAQCEHGERGARGGGADGVADDHGVVARLRRLHVAQAEARGGCAADQTCPGGIRQRSAVQEPLVSERSRAGRRDGEGDGSVLARLETRRRRGDDGRVAGRK